MSRHRQLIEDLPVLNDDADQIPDKGPLPGEEFSFQNRVDDTVTDITVSHESDHSGRVAAPVRAKFRTCADCGYRGRFPSEVKRHRGYHKDICPEVKRALKDSKKK